MHFIGIECTVLFALQIWAECGDIVRNLLDQDTLEVFGQPVDVSADCLVCGTALNNAACISGHCCGRLSGLCYGADLPLQPCPMPPSALPANEVGMKPVPP